MQEIFHKIKNVDTENTYMRMDQFMRVFGGMIQSMDKESVNTVMVDYMKENGNTERKMEWEKFIMLMEQDLKALLKMTNIMVLESKYTQMEQYLQENGKWVK